MEQLDQSLALDGRLECAEACIERAFELIDAALERFDTLARLVVVEERRMRRRDGELRGDGKQQDDGRDRSAHAATQHPAASLHRRVSLHVARRPQRRLTSRDPRIASLVCGGTGDAAGWHRYSPA